jgi:hypothetical protein
MSDTVSPPHGDHDEQQARRAADVVADLGHRVGTASTLARAIATSPLQTGFPEAVSWRAPSVAQGHAGLAVLFGALDTTYPQQGWDRLGHEHLSIAAHAAADTPGLPASLFCGSAGLGFAALGLSRGGERYTRLLASVDDAVAARVRFLAGRLGDGSSGRAVREFDLISGLSGVGAYLLARASDAARALLPTVLSALAGLIVAEQNPPAWHTPVTVLESPEQRERYPEGNLNCGLAHGLPGPLALLSLAALDGHRTALGEAAIGRAAGWLLAHHVTDAWGVNWPDAVPVVAAGDPPPHHLGRTTWCYGAPGIARALWLAGRALDDECYRAFAVRAMADAVRKPSAARGLTSVTYCHGTAGLLHIVSTFARDTGLPIFRTAAHDLLDEVLGGYEPDSLLGYVSLEPDLRRVDQPGLLDGAPGVALALLSAVSTADCPWGRLFLLN